MANPLQLICTDFDGTLHSDYTMPPVPEALQNQLGSLQKAGAVWVINTGRTLEDLRFGLARADLSVHPDYVVVVEREIYRCNEDRFESLTDWNERCAVTQAGLFAGVADRLPDLFDWVNLHFNASVYEDAWSPFCLIARNNADADAIQAHVNTVFADVPELTFVRNDVYGRLSHTAFTKGTALSELARRLQIPTENILAAGDHWNDLSMLHPDHARWIIAPANAIPEVADHIETVEGYLAKSECGDGVFEGINWALEQATAQP